MVLKPDKFTEQAQEVLGTSQELVRQFRHSQWDIEHLVVALLQLERGLPVEIMESLGVDVDAMKRRLEDVLERSPKMAHESSQVYAAPRAVHLVENAKREADRLKDEFIGTEHLLIAATVERGGRRRRHSQGVRCRPGEGLQGPPGDPWQRPRHRPACREQVPFS